MQVAGVEYDINWRAFTKGKALFFPCLDYKKASRSEEHTSELQSH